MPRIELISLAQLLAELGEDDEHPLARSTFDDWKAKGEAPEGFKLPNGQWRFRRTTIDAWIGKLEDAIP